MTEQIIDAVPSATLKSQVALKLREAILAGNYAPGDRLNEARLAHEFNISRIPIREALIQLQESGLVMNNERRGMCVTKLSEEDMQRINSVRLVLETEALWLARANMTPDVAAKLENVVERMENMANPLFDSAALDLEFHHTMWKASGNPYLIKALDMLISQLFAHKALEHRIFARSAPPHAREEMRVWRVGHHHELLNVVLGRSDTDPQQAVLDHMRAGFDEPERYSSLMLREQRK
ncbi:MAG TPA: GntR family transcriptional regulator [Rhizomicrobium sp.]